MRRERERVGSEEGKRVRREREKMRSEVNSWMNFLTNSPHQGVNKVHNRHMYPYINLVQVTLSHLKNKALTQTLDIDLLILGRLCGRVSKPSRSQNDPSNRLQSQERGTEKHGG